MYMITMQISIKIKIIIKELGVIATIASKCTDYRKKYYQVVLDQVPLFKYTSMQRVLTIHSLLYTILTEDKINK